MRRVALLGAFLVCRPKHRSATAALIVHDGSIAQSYSIYSRWGQWWLAETGKYDSLVDLVADGCQGRLEPASLAVDYQ